MNIVHIRRLIGPLWSDEDGVTAIEYALLAALIAGVIVIGVGALGDAVGQLYDDIAAKVDDVIN